MKNYFLLISFLFFTCFSTLAQIDKEWISKASEYSKIYKDDNVLILNSYEKYSFDIKKSEGDEKVIAFKEVFTEFLSLKDITYVLFGEGYNSFSNVNRIRVEQNTGNKYKHLPLAENDNAISSEEIFDHDERKKYAILPLNKNGLRIRGNYFVDYSDVRYLCSAYLVDDYPILEKKIEIEVPSFLEIEIKEFNFSDYDIEKKSEIIKNGTNKITYVIKNSDGVNFEKNSPAASKTLPHIVFVSKKFKTNSGQEKLIFNSTNDQYKWYKTLTSSIENNDEGLQALSDEIISNAKNDEEKIKVIYYWVQDNIKYIAFERGIAGFKPDAASKVYKNKFGDCKGMANLLTTLLQKAGFDARLAWIGTNDIPYDYSLHSLIVDNHMISYLKHNGVSYFLDGTEKFIALNENADRIHGKEVLIDDGINNYKIEKVVENTIDKNAVIKNEIIKIQNQELKLKIDEIYNGQSKRGILNALNSIPKNKHNEFFQYFLSENNKNIVINKVELLNYENRELPIKINYESTVNNKIIQNEDELFVSIDLNQEIDEFLFSEKRKSAFEVKNNFNFKNQKSIFFPNGYTIESIPENIMISKENYILQVNFERKEDKIIVTKNFEIKSQIVLKKDFKNWIEDFKKVKNILADQLIFKKI